MFLIVKKGVDISHPDTETDMFVGSTIADAAEQWAAAHEEDDYTPPLPDELDVYELKKVEA